MESIYYILIMFAIVMMGYFWYIVAQLKRLVLNIRELEHRVSTLEKMTDNCMDLVSKLTANVHALDKEMDTARDAMSEWSEAGKIARKSEEDFNEGLNNILNFQPGVTKKGDKN